MDLVKILDLNKFQLREDKFSKGEEDECNKSVSWRALADEKNKGKYIKVLSKINTNPKYQVFHQLYFQQVMNINTKNMDILKQDYYHILKNPYL